MQINIKEKTQEIVENIFWTIRASMPEENYQKLRKKIEKELLDEIEVVVDELYQTLPY